ncbi:MAG: NosD domain-containing protein [Candidatus Hodarchaeota archaeon]
MLLKNRKKTILTVATLTIVIIFANILQASTISFVPLKVEAFSQNNSSDIDTQNNIGLDDLKEDTTSFSDDKISDFQYDLSSMKIRDDNKVEFVIKKDGLEITPEINQLFIEYDVEIHKELNSINCIIVYISLDSIESFILDAESTLGIAYAEPNYIYKASFIPNDYYYLSHQWDLPLIGMESAWDYGLGSHDVLVAVIDTGIDYNHPDLTENYVPLGYDWINDDNDPWDDEGHGTHCAGTIAASINNGVGIAGMANVSIFAEKSLNATGYGTHAQVASGVEHAVAMGADIISLSLGGYYDSSTLRVEIENAIDQGVMVIAAAGNDGVNIPHYPAAYPDVIAVAATDQNDQRADFPGWWASNFGDWIDISAPGAFIYSTIPGNGYAAYSGTSMACPHVAGLAALIMSKSPTITPSEIEELIIDRAVDLGDSGWDKFYGWGRIDANNLRLSNPIHIDDSAGNNWEWAKDEFALPGSGEEWNPYVIQDLIIYGSGSGSCILIENSNAYFRIENCEVYNSGSFVNDAGIKLINTNNGEIIDNDCSQNYGGILLEESNINTISGNTANKNDNFGIHLLGSEKNTVSGNTVNENYFGIYLANSNDTTITENTFSDNSIGILILGTSSYNTFYLNSFYRSPSSHVYYFLYSGSGDSWDNGSIGNYWDDYTGVDDDDNGIGDTHYYKNGAIDKYPIWDDGPYGGKIHIDNHDWNNWTWASTRIWCSGSGTPNDPYVIQDLILDAGGSGSCILIENSNAYFRIENCEVYNSGSFVLDAGIKLYNTINGKIINNICSQNKNGIFLWNSNDNTVSGNIANKNDNIGIPIVYSDDNTISGNIINDNSDAGLFLFVSERNTVSGNTVNDNDAEGLYLYSSDDNSVTGNNFIDNTYGILIMGTSSYNTFYLNSFYSSSISHAKYDSSYIGTGNSWDSGSIGNFWDDYEKKYPYANPDGNIWNMPYDIYVPLSQSDNYPIYSHEPIHIDDNAGNNWEWATTKVWCSGSGTLTNPYVIQYRKIDAGGSGSCILIENSEAYFRIENCLVFNAGTGGYPPYEEAGIKLNNTNNGKIIDNDCSNNIYGIFLQSSNDNIVSGNTANDNDYTGIIIDNSDDNTISENTANDNDYTGILLYSSNGNTISGNTANNNGNSFDGAGIYLYKSDFNNISRNILINNGRAYYYDGYGIYLGEESTLNILKNNLIVENSNGIYFYRSGNNKVTENVLVDNELYAISLTNSYDNTIYLNSFYGTDVYLWDYWLTDWDYGGLGNYWDDYKERYPYANPDGNIWDTPYVISSSTGFGGIDYFPLVNPYDSRDKENPIHIDDTAWNNWAWAKSQGLCSGFGTEEEPYVIKDLIIKGGPVPGIGISIKNSEAYFRIENCKVHHSGTGITLKNTNNGEIINNDFSQNTIGISLENSDGNTLRNNLLVDNVIGLIIRDYSSENSVIGNSFTDNLGGILIAVPWLDNTIHSNSFYGGRWDFYYV